MTAPLTPVVPLPGIGPQAARDALAAALLDVGNLRTGGLAGPDRLNAYRRWSTQTASALRHLLRPADVDRLVATPRHWALHALDPAAHLDNGAGLVDLELDIRRDELQAEVNALDAVVARRGAHHGALVVADTNIYLHHPKPFDEIDWAPLVPDAGHAGIHLVVPLLVVDELDRQKQGQSGKPVVRGGKELARTRARTTIRTLEELFDDPAAIPMVRPGPPPVRAELLLDPLGHARLASPDAEIVDRACAVRDLFGSQVTVVARDTGMVFRARNAGLFAFRLPDVSDPSASA
jgi:hypothetical protein